VSEPVAEPRAEDRHALNVLITSVAQLGTMLCGGLLAVVIAHRFGATARTDAMFAAYSTYSVLLAIAQSLRLTMVPRFAQADAASFLEGLRGVAIVVALSAVPLVALGDPMSRLLVGDGEREVARDALALFWLAAGFQLVAGYGAAQLAALGRFGSTAIAYFLSALLPVLLLAVWPDPGILLVPGAIVVGSLVCGTAVAVLAARGSRRPEGRPGEGWRGAWRGAGQMVAGAIGSVTWQIALVVTLGVAARADDGSVTVYTYAFFGASLVAGVTSGSISMVIAAPITAAWDRLDPAPLVPALLGLTRATAVLSVPVVGMGLVCADEVVDLVLGGSLTPQEIDGIRDAFVALLGLMLASGMSPVPALAAYARGWFGAVAGVALAGLAAHVVMSLAVGADRDLTWLAVVASISSFLVAGGTIGLIWRAQAPRVIAAAGWAALQPVVLGAAVFVPVALLGTSTAGALAGALVAAAVYGLGIRLLLPAYWGPLEDAVRSVLRR